MTISDRSLATLVRRLQDLPGQHLFQYEDADGACAVGSDEVNAYIREAMGADFSAKHFRTFHASSLAFERLATGEGHVKLSQMLEHVAERLGNTPAIARSSYVHPAVIARIEGQEDWRKGLQLPRKTRWLTRTERGLIAFLEECGAASDFLSCDQG